MLFNDLTSFVIFAVAASHVLSCPSPEAIYPCTCDGSGWYSKISCAKMENERNLVRMLNSLKGLEEFYTFTITEGNFRYIPHDAFEKVKAKELVIQFSSFMAFTDADVAFKGLENDLASLVIIDCSLMNTWDWSVFRELKSLVKLQIDVDMEFISEDIGLVNPLNIQIIDFSHNKISHIAKTAFAGCSQLHTLALEDNLIKELERSMLPVDAQILWKIDLSFNKIERLPPDMFENMPSLEVLNLNDNNILTLNEKTFDPVWGKLNHLNLQNNELRCDCRLSWILNKKFPDDLIASCYQPKKLQGRSFTSLTSVDLRCFYIHNE